MVVYRGNAIMRTTWHGGDALWVRVVLKVVGDRGHDAAFYVRLWRLKNQTATVIQSRDDPLEHAPTRVIPGLEASCLSTWRSVEKERRLWTTIDRVRWSLIQQSHSILRESSAYDAYKSKFDNSKIRELEHEAIRYILIHSIAVGLERLPRIPCRKRRVRNAARIHTLHKNRAPHT